VGSEDLFLVIGLKCLILLNSARARSKKRGSRQVLSVIINGAANAQPQHFCKTEDIKIAD
jgi:ribosomal protein L22